MTALPIREAAPAIGVSVPTLKRWLRAGAPVARRGGRGRGRAALIDPAAVRAWRRAEGGSDALLVFSSLVPEIVARAIDQSFGMTRGLCKQQAAAVLAGAWYVTSCQVLDAIRKQCPSVPELTIIPERIERLRKIARE